MEMRPGKELSAIAGALDIVIPVFGAPEDLDRCLASVVDTTLIPPHRLVLVLDGPQGGAVEEVIARRVAGGSGGIKVERLPQRRGFAAAANHGMFLGRGDVVLLNSDTIVTSGWLEGLARAAAGAPDVGTVTPLSNNATLCSIPESFEENLLPRGMGAQEMADLVGSLGPPGYPELPTGVGFCLLIRRALLDAVGGFDADRFGLGYGEENDLCERGRRAGYRNLAADDVFVYHAGRRSFGRHAASRERAAQRRLGRAYRRRVAVFMREDPLRERRRRLVGELQRRWSIPTPAEPEERLSVMHVVHGWPPFDHGGCESYARSLAVDQARRHRVSAFVRIADGAHRTGDRVAYLDAGVRVRLVCNRFDQRDPLARSSLINKDMERQLLAFIEAERPRLVHVHHLAGHGANLIGAVVRRGLPVVYQVQDWWAGCARANLGLPDGSLCPGPRPDRCADCLPLTGVRPRRPLNLALHMLRRALLKRALRRCSAFIMGSRAVFEWHRRAGLLPAAAHAEVLEYGVGLPPPDESSTIRPPFDGSRPLRIGVIGAVMPHKGVHIAVEALGGVDPGRAQLVVWGRLDAAPGYVESLKEAARPEMVHFHGSFADEDKIRVLSGLDLLAVPSTALESFGIVAREAMAVGVPVVASRLGALAELELESSGCGAFFEPGDARGLRAIIDHILADPTILERWRGRLPAPRPVAEHAAEVDRVYREVLCRSRP